MALFELTGFQCALLFVIAGFDRPSGQQTMDRLGKNMNQDFTPGDFTANREDMIDTVLEFSNVIADEIETDTHEPATEPVTVEQPDDPAAQ